MKRKATILALVLAFVMTCGAFTSVFAMGPATEETTAAIDAQKIRCTMVMKDEVDAEAIAKSLHDQVVLGKYKLIDTKELGTRILENNEKPFIIDTMPENWWAAHHVPGAVCQIVGANAGPEFKITPEESAALLKLVTDKVGKVSVKYFWNSKTKKWVTKKPAKKYWKKCTKKKDKFYGKKTKTVKEVNKNKEIIVYCGFTKCQRSHQAAMYLTKMGFKNVKRYAGGITAWVDAGYPIEGTDVDSVETPEPTPEP